MDLGFMDSKRRKVLLTMTERPTIAVLMGNTQSEYAEDLIYGFSTFAKEENVNLIFLMRESMPRYHGKSFSEILGEDYHLHFSSIYDYVPYVKPDALIIAYGSLSVFRDTPEKQEMLKAFQNVPCVVLECPSEDEQIPFLITDNYGGMRQCMEHLVYDHGYRKIAFLSGPRANHDTNERMRAYRDVMRENALPVTETMIAYGDYSENVDSQVEYLLDNNVGLEAIAFANDSMAKAGYRVCAARNLVVGKDIAITGFDDVDLAKNMTPPLTSVAHSSFLFSYQALQNAIALCRGEKCLFQKMPVIFHKRGSCGCLRQEEYTPKSRMGLMELERMIESRTIAMSERMFESFPYEKEKKEYLVQLQGYFLYVYEEVFVRECKQFAFDELHLYLKRLCSFRHVSHRAMLDEIISFLRELTEYTWTERMNATLGSCIEGTQRYIYSKDVVGMEMANNIANRRAWLLSTFTRDLLNQYQSPRENISTVLDRLQKMAVPSAYFFLYDEPVIRDGSFPSECSAKMYLEAYYNDKERFCADRGECPVIDIAQGISAYLPKDGSHFYTVYALFFENEHYGIMVCEADQKDIYFLLSCSLQIGALFHTLRLQRAEQQVRRQLEEALQMIQEKNNILSFISEYDELSKLLNRRGFMEKSLQTIKANEGRQAYLLFADVDHLKEINDCFGHGAGDFAICTAADYLRRCLPADAIAARIGGDEFVALVLTDQCSYCDRLTDRLKACAAEFNDTHGKPYYIEMSAGIYPFVCKGDIELTEILKESDSILYEKKLNRRASIKKEL
jgi:diguanylate cyclase (GGDEF)-like protein